MARGSKIKNDFLEDGNKVELAWAQSCMEEYVFSTAEEDMTEHWDVKNPHTGLKFDVKGLKKTNRYEDPDENIHWIELRNVNGDLGWVYGMADYIVFETNDYWVVVEREVLQHWAEDNVKPEPIYNKPTLMGVYQRKDRKDKVVLVKTIDLIYLSSNLIKK